MRQASRWTAPDDIAASVGQLWESGAILRARFESVPIFPYELRLRQPGAIEIGQQFEAVRDWIATLTSMSRDARGHGYELVWREINHRQIGRNRIPVAALIPNETDALRIIGRASDARRFDQLAALTLEAFHGLRSWVARQPFKLIQHGEQWERVLAVLRWFMAHPQPRIYLRQLDIAGVDTKFIESYKALFLELLNEIMPTETIVPTAAGVRQFEERFGLLTKPALIRFRMLDPDYYIAGLSDLTVPVSQFAKFYCQVRRIFITENEINALAFPDIPGGMVIFGGGYGIERLAQVEWLGDKEVLYWGDIDTHGFVILDRLRSHVPHTRSLLMDAQTLHAHRALWGKEETAARYTGELNRLSEEEYRLFVELRDNIHGPNLRMEQERIPYTWAVKAIRHALAGLGEPVPMASEAGRSPY